MCTEIENEIDRAQSVDTLPDNNGLSKEALPSNPDGDGCLRERERKTANVPLRSHNASRRVFVVEGKVALATTDGLIEA